jgi:hypothetical protein
MPELSVTDDQLRRLETVREELEAAYVGPYGTVSREEALEYLLDTYSPPAERAEDVAGQADAGNPTAGAPDERPGGDAGGGSESTPDGTDGGGSDGATGAVGDGSPENALQQAMNLLEAYDDRWRESGGDEPYEVDLPDGSTEGVRTKDDVKRLLFKHWK